MGTEDDWRRGLHEKMWEKRLEHYDYRNEDWLAERRAAGDWDAISEHRKERQRYISLSDQYGKAFSFAELDQKDRYDRMLVTFRENFGGQNDSEEEIIAKLENYDKEYEKEVENYEKQKHEQEQKQGRKVAIYFLAATLFGLAAIITGFKTGHWFFGIVTGASLFCSFFGLFCVDRKGVRRILAVALLVVVILVVIGLFAYVIYKNERTAIIGAVILVGSLVSTSTAIGIGGVPVKKEPESPPPSRKIYFTSKKLREEKAAVEKIDAAHGDEAAKARVEAEAKVEAKREAEAAEVEAKREAEKAAEKAKKFAVRKKVAIVGLVLQIGVTAAFLYLVFNGAFNNIFGELPYVLQIVLPVGAPALVIGIISLIFKRDSDSFGGLLLIPFIDIAMVIFMTKIDEVTKISLIILGFVVFSITAIPGFIIACQETGGLVYLIPSKQQAIGGIISSVLLILTLVFLGIRPVAFTPQPAAEVTETQTETATVNANVNFRSGPSTNNTIIRQIQRGDTVTLTGEVSGSWSQVSHNGDTGWVSSEFLDK